MSCSRRAVQPATAGWPTGHELACSAQGYELRVWDAHEERDAVEREKRMVLYGIKELPAIVVDGELLACCS